MKRSAFIFLTIVGFTILLFFSSKYTKGDLINDLNSIITPEEEAEIFLKVRPKVKLGFMPLDENNQDIGQDDDWFEKLHSVMFYYDTDGIPYVLKDKRNVFLLLRPD